MRLCAAFVFAYVAVFSKPCTSARYYPDSFDALLRKKVPYDDVVLLVTARHYLSDAGLARRLVWLAPPESVLEASFLFHQLLNFLSLIHI